MLSIIKLEQDGCCDLDLISLENNGSIETYFPFREEALAQDIEDRWYVMCVVMCMVMCVCSYM